MDINAAIDATLDNKAILFVGAGFSHGAKNSLGDPFPTGNELRDLLAKECGEVMTDYSLQQVADYYKSQFGAQKLVDYLVPLFSVSEISDFHKRIMSLPWKRAYSTNYDHVVEKASQSNKLTIQSVIASDKTWAYNPGKVCVHLNGSIER